jgi:16S rRNA processing protein RimM
MKAPTAKSNNQKGVSPSVGAGGNESAPGEMGLRPLLPVLEDEKVDRQASADRLILLGCISGVFGVRGEIKIESWTDPRDAIFRYQPWTMLLNGVSSRLAGLRGRAHGPGLVANVPGIADRDAAEQLTGSEIFVSRSVLPPPKAGEYYWVDLEGLQVTTTEGLALGTVSHLFDTGANHVVVVKGDRERLIPFVQPYLVSVDFDQARIMVDWDPDF